MNNKFITSKLFVLAFGFAVFSFLLISCNKRLSSSGGRNITFVEGLIPKAEQIILGALAEDNPFIKTKAIEAVGSTHRGELMKKVTKLLTDENVPVRYSAALAAGNTKYKIAKSNLERLLSDENKNVRIAAAYALYKIGDGDMINFIRKAIISNDQTVRANATFLMGECGDKNSLKLLYRVMREESSEYKVSLQAAQAIAKLGDEEIYAKLWTMLISTYADVRVMGIRGMGALGTLESKNALIRMLDDPILEVRLAAAEQLGMLNDNIAEPEVLDVFEKNLTADMDKEARQRVNVLTAMAIGQIGTESLTGFLPQLLDDSSKLVRIAAAKAVFQCSNQK
ncbi:HEAT repeat domain-containing protein [Planctomycetota bacterium]